jgi:hypothetical protein
MIAAVDWDALLQVLWSATVAGIGVTAAFGFAIVGVTRAVDARRGGQVAPMAMFGALGFLALAVVLAAVVFSIIVMTSK